MKTKYDDIFMSANFKVEKNKPIPNKAKAKTQKASVRKVALLLRARLYNNMEVGDSILLPHLAATAFSTWVRDRLANQGANSKNLFKMRFECPQPNTEEHYDEKANGTKYVRIWKTSSEVIDINKAGLAGLEE